MVENIVREGEIACYKQFLFFSHNVFYSYMSLMRQNLALCGNGLNTTSHNGVSENTFQLSGYGVGLLSRHSQV